MRAAHTALALIWLIGCSDPTSDPTKSRFADASKQSWKVIGVTDGDTITVLTESQEQVKVRMQGLDAPELHQACGDAAKRALSE